MENRRRRVPAMAPDERRAALIQATIPLLHEHGIDVSTRQIAEAAGVAEGTIFGVFENKNKLVVVSMIQALDPQVTLDALAAIDRAAPLRARFAAAADLVHARFAANAHLMNSARRVLTDTDPDSRERMAAYRSRLLSEVADVLTPDQHLLRRSPGTVARLLLLYCSADTYGPYGEPGNFSGDELASLLLDGLITITATTKIRGAQSTC